MMSFFLFFFKNVNSQIYSLEDNIICNDILCDQGSYANNIYNYGQERFGDLSGSQFSLQFFIQIDAQIASAIGQGFIVSIMDGSLVVLDLKQKNLNSFKITSQGVATDLTSFQSINWYQIYITQSKIYISDWSQTLNYAHSIIFSSSHRFNFFTQATGQFWSGQACCIIMYKGILVDNKYFNGQLYIQSNTKYPEAIIDINVQEKLQSNITYDYSDYQQITRLGNSFDFDFSDPYLLDDSLLFNGSQYLNVYDVYLNYQYTIEFRIKLTTLTQNIQLFSLNQLSYYITIKLKPSIVLEFDLNGQTSQFTLQSQSQLHFCIAIIFYLDDVRLQYSIQFIQFTNSGILTHQGFYQQSPTQFQKGSSTLTIGSILNQFNAGEYFELYHFRFYQGYFIDDTSAIDPLCQIYMNDRCIICKSEYLLSENNQCLSQCSQLQLTTHFNAQHNQCIRQCHTNCATCSSPTECLTCSGDRLNPPNCNCPNGYFDDYVSPNCRKYFQDIQTQTGQQLVQCSSTGNLCQQINFIYQYNSIPQVGIFLIGASQNIETTKSNMWTNSVTKYNFQICVECDTQKQFFQFQWMSSVGDNFYKATEGHYSDMNSQLFTRSITNYQNQISYPQILGWKQQTSGASFQIKIQNQQSTSFQVSSQNPLNFIKYNVVYTNFLTIQYSYATSITQNLDNIPKSVKILTIFQGLQTNNSTGTFKQMMSSRYINSMKMYSRLPIVNLNGQLLFTAQQCSTGTCDFYESYLSTCNLNFQLCSCNELNYFINANNQCQKCDQNCQKCSGLSSQCTQCHPYQNKQLLNSQCICGSKQYLDINSVCNNCDTLCSACTTTSSNCQSCISDAQMQNGICVCNPGRYTDLVLQSCQICHVNCQRCIGQSLNSCLSCDQDKVYNSQLMTCECPFSQFLDQNFSCDDCHITCKTCISNSYADCLSCANLRSLVVNQYNNAHECICKSGYYQDDTGNCQQCLSSCSECQNNSSCMQCSKNRTLHLQSQQCVCNSGYFEQSIEQNCLKCSFNCSSCINEKQCISCFNNSEINNFICQCKQGFFLNNNYCVSCNSLFGLQQVSCQTQVCGDGIKTDQEQCDDGSNLDGDGCNSSCQLEFGFSYENGLIVQNAYPQPYLIESNGNQQIYNPQRIFQLYFKQELQFFELNIEQFIEIRIQNKSLNQDYTFHLINYSQSNSNLYLKINITIQLQLLTSFENKEIEVYFNNPQQIKTQQGFQQQIIFINTQISDYLYTDQQTRNLTDNLTNTTYYMLYLILGLVILSILTGGIEIFYNLLDLLQIISYLKYVNTQFPYNLATYLNLFSFLQMKILDDYIDFSQYIVDYDQLYISPTKINDDGIVPNIIVNLSSYIFVWIIFFATFLLAHIIPFIMKYVQFDLKSKDIKSINIQYKTFVMIIKEFIVKQCKLLQNQFLFSGFFRTYLSTAYDFCFYLSLNLYFLSFNDFLINQIASYLTVIFLMIYFIIFTMVLNIVKLKSYDLIINEQKYGSIYEGLKLKNRYYKYYNIYLLLKRLLFMIFLVLPYSDPLFQITVLISLQTIQVIFILMKPLKEQFEQNKQTLCEILMLIIEINIFILVIDDFFDFTDRPVIGWICIIIITILLASQILFDSVQQWIKIRKIYNKFQKYIQQQLKENQQQLNHENLLIQV